MKSPFLSSDLRPNGFVPSDGRYDHVIDYWRSKLKRPADYRLTVDCVRQYGPIFFYKNDSKEQMREVDKLCDVVWHMEEDRVRKDASFFSRVNDSVCIKLKYFFWRPIDSRMVYGQLFRIRLFEIGDPVVDEGPMMHMDEGEKMVKLLNETMGRGAFEEGDLGYVKE